MIQSILQLRGFSFSDGFYKPTNQIRGAHNKAEQNPSTKAKKRRGSARGMAPSVVSVLVAHNRAQQRLFFKPSLCVVVFSSCRTASRAWQWFCSKISTPSSPPEPSTGKQLAPCVTKLVQSGFIVLIFVIFPSTIPNQCHQDVGPQEELHRAPPRPRSAADFPLPGFLHADETRWVSHHTGQPRLSVKYTNKTGLNVCSSTP